MVMVNSTAAPPGPVNVVGSGTAAKIPVPRFATSSSSLTVLRSTLLNSNSSSYIRRSFTQQSPSRPPPPSPSASPALLLRCSRSHLGRSRGRNTEGITVMASRNDRRRSSGVRTTANHLRHVESMATLPSGAGEISHLNAIILGEALASEEDDLVFPGDDFSAQALVPSPQKYLDMYKRSVEDPAGFWSDIASEFYWKQKWGQPVLTENLDVRKGTINVQVAAVEIGQESSPFSDFWSCS